MVGLVLVAGVANGSILGLVAQWDFDGDIGSWMVTDTSPSGGMDGALTSNAAVIADPYGQRGGVLDPTLGYAQVPTVQKAVNFNTTYTMSYWVGPVDRNQNGLNDDVNEQWKWILMDSTGGAGHRMASMNSGMLGAVQHNPGDGWNPINIWRGSAWDPADPGYDGTGPWHHCLYTYDGNIQYGYVDGVLYQTTDRADGGWWNWPLPGTVHLGADGNGANGTAWLIDEISFVHGYSDPTIVANLYAGGDVASQPWVPEPATIALLGLGGLALMRRKR
jgi:hypothetical protein